jgi:hypothetical protein
MELATVPHWHHTPNEQQDNIAEQAPYVPLTTRHQC